MCSPNEIEVDGEGHLSLFVNQLCFDYVQMLAKKVMTLQFRFFLMGSITRPLTTFTGDRSVPWLTRDLDIQPREVLIREVVIMNFIEVLQHGIFALVGVTNAGSIS